MIKSGFARKLFPHAQALEAIRSVMRTEIPLEKMLLLPLHTSSSVHQYYEQSETAGLFETRWQPRLGLYNEFEDLGWEWPNNDGVLLKAPLG